MASDGRTSHVDFVGVWQGKEQRSVAHGLPDLSAHHPYSLGSSLPFDLAVAHRRSDQLTAVCVFEETRESLSLSRCRISTISKSLFFGLLPCRKAVN